MKPEVPLNAVTRPAWQRKEQVIAVLHPHCPQCDLVRHRLGFHPGPLGDPEVSVQVLDARPPTDATADFRRAAGQAEDSAFVLLGNRFLELYAVLEPHQMPAEDLEKDVIAWVEVMAQRCAECSLDGAEYR
jgi:hypothetical protein